MTLTDADEQRLQLLSATLIAFDNRNAVLEAIAGSDTADAGRRALEEKFDLTEAQATHVMSIPLYRFSGDALSRVQAEHRALLARRE